MQKPKNAFQFLYRSCTAGLPLDYRSITARVPFQTVFPVIISIMNKAKPSKKEKSETSVRVSFLFFQRNLSKEVL